MVKYNPMVAWMVRQVVASSALQKPFGIELPTPDTAKTLALRPACARPLCSLAVAFLDAHLSASAGPSDVAAAHAGAALNVVAIAMTLANAVWTLRLLVHARRARPKVAEFL